MASAVACPIGCLHGVSHRSAPARQIRHIPTTSSVFPLQNPFCLSIYINSSLFAQLKARKTFSLLSFWGPFKYFSKKRDLLERRKRRRTVKVTVKLLCVTCSVLRWKQKLKNIHTHYYFDTRTLLTARTVRRDRDKLVIVDWKSYSNHFLTHVQYSKEEE